MRVCSEEVVVASTVLDTAPRSEVAMIDPNRESGEVLIAEMASTNQGRQPIDLRPQCSQITIEPSGGVELRGTR